MTVGIMLIYQTAEAIPGIWFGLPSNVLLTLMVVTRLILNVKNARAAMGTTRVGGLRKAPITVLTESSALYAARSKLVSTRMGKKMSTALVGPLETHVRAFPHSHNLLRAGCLM